MGEAGISEVKARATLAARERLPRLLLLAAWALATLILVSQHIMWRDEVRALSIALQGDTVIEMLRGLQGEGHPALWYLLLRFAHAVVPVPEVLPAVAWAVAAGAMAILALKAPLRLSTIAIIMFGGFGLFEYVVDARNYGLSMLVLFAIAALYPRYRDRSVAIGCLLALLCNTNVPATFLAAGLLGFWLVELVSEEGLRWTPKHSWFAANVAIALVGLALCFVQVFPTVHDAAPNPAPITLAAVVDALVSPATAFPDLATRTFEESWLRVPLLTILLVGMILGLVRRPAALLSGLAVFLIFELFLRLVYLGSYRHHGLLIMFFVTLYWLVAAGRGGQWRGGLDGRFWRGLATAGGAAFSLLLALQLSNSMLWTRAAVAGVPESRVRDLAQLLDREGLGDAILVAVPDILLEPLPYYADNPIYLLREQRFGSVVRFTRDARLHLDLDIVLAEARALNERFGRPVVIVLHHRLDPAEPAYRVQEQYAGSFTSTPQSVARFLASTRRLASFEPATSDESYDVYLLKAS
jgi:hypothetical protein